MQLTGSINVKTKHVTNISTLFQKLYYFNHDVVIENDVGHARCRTWAAAQSDTVEAIAMAATGVKQREATSRRPKGAV